MLAIEVERPGDCLDDAARAHLGLVFRTDQSGELVASEPVDDR
jgi:hypothetical protein